MQMQQGMAMMMQMQQMMQMMGGGGGAKSNQSLDEYMKDQSQMNQMSQMMAAGMMDPSMVDPSMMMGQPTIEQQIMEAKPMLKNMDTTTKKFIDTHCHIDVLFKKEQYDGDWETYVYVTITYLTHYISKIEIQGSKSWRGFQI